MRTKTLCFTGHRDIPKSELAEIIKRLVIYLEACIQHGIKNYIAGGARGFDTIAACTVLKLRERHPQIRLILALPCEDQTKGWSAEDIEMYNWIFAQADEIVYTSQSYFRGCMQKRNRYMVDNSKFCLCYLTKNTGGTAYTVNYAQKHRLSVINLAEK
ncbi:DUF1273 family protein [Butyricicoccus sp. 1XD8-22]|nr:DUF1273 family protein [Butyricicoccus sp. 1XD8-22]